MLTSQKIVDGLNEQIGHEFSAMLQYTAISAHFSAEALPELAAHFAQQAEEEKLHAHKFIQYVINIGARVHIPTVPPPKCKFTKAEDAVKLSLDQEKKVSSQINALVHLAKKEEDYTSDNFLQWFIQEQLEEVSSMQDLLNVVHRAGEGNLLRVEDYLARESGKMRKGPPGP